LKREVLLTSDLLWWHRFSLKPREAEARLLAEMPGLKDATVTCALFPTACEIVVTEREPALVWIDGADIYWIDDDGVVFTAQGQRPQLPVVRGPLPDVEAPEVSEDVIAAEIAAEAVEMTDEAAAEAIAAAVAEAEAEAAAAAAAELARMFGAVQEGIAALAELGLPTDSLEYNPQRGLIWVDGEGRRVAFGVGPDMAARWQMYEALIAHLDSEGIFPWTVDVRFPGGITYSLERSW
jgi:hypothetical protein